MENWDNVRVFLAVARHGSVRAASNALQLNHSTVLRRVSQMEAQLGARLFEKLPTGYELTPAGAEIQSLAEEMEQSSSLLQSRVFARDQRLTGKLRVAMPPSLVADLLMPDLADFSREHPEIELQIISSYEPVNLTRRQADVAIRLVYDQFSLPQHLVGQRLHDVYRGVYISQALLNESAYSERDCNKWILKEEDNGLPDWALVGSDPTSVPPMKVNDVFSQLAAVRADIGKAILPCFVADADMALVRVPKSEIAFYGTLWMLTYGDTRKTNRVRLFGKFIKERVDAHAELLKGKSPVDASMK
ncbi:LysR family transcriptional regulator [Pseudohalocynthiibacter aestuariivivens]|jgi:DNA-binding transcriptional LysR family regulator|uniref:LysR family transcriptional regulator n=1 Tax=Pseudohalocynthiibacter aestuariivivens TaxID=1591409 RepID=A0ABV5JI41_9RHOB|nr:MULTISPECIES: LysR family transcriptional regulator [Pseudohalocynthiibacter]MBS9717428.1 LysR family transcriptional regulator [Pseudohalocynthiibacter aestuariivivens]MCK0102238.1 LysR family transcriptional regulator [Pseudohalocynthiibacter sp. F2068]